ncbi:hypothetical protein MNBD_GAMMA22-2687 [hydrothermal vent metagenome]|uniref:Spermidine synthase n=1 Tax=hydrothermal vent metagenome TaxID=652676 RepID=A0A3B0ZZ78_9ZZZZ
MNNTIEAILSQDSTQTRILQLISTGNGKLTIEENGSYRWIRDNDTAYYSILDKSKPERLVLPYLQSMMAVLMFVCEIKSILVLGAGGGALLRYFNKYLPQSILVGIDNDHRIIEATNKYFLNQQWNSPLIKNTDAMSFILQASQEHYDLIFVDLFSYGAIPDFFSDVEFYQQCKQSLGSGVIAFNLIIESEADFKLIMSHLLQVFNKRCLCLTVNNYKNIIVLAFSEQTEFEQDTIILRKKSKNLGNIYDINFEQLLDEMIETNVCINGKLQY